MPPPAARPPSSVLLKSAVLRVLAVRHSADPPTLPVPGHRPEPVATPCRRHKSASGSSPASVRHLMYSLGCRPLWRCRGARPTFARTGTANPTMRCPHQSGRASAASDAGALGRLADPPEQFVIASCRFFRTLLDVDGNAIRWSAVDDPIAFQTVAVAPEVPASRLIAKQHAGPAAVRDRIVHHHIVRVVVADRDAVAAVRVDFVPFGQSELDTPAPEQPDLVTVEPVANRRGRCEPDPGCTPSPAWS